MIEILEGTHETINYGNSMGVRMFRIILNIGIRL